MHLRSSRIPTIGKGFPNILLAEETVWEKQFLKLSITHDIFLQISYEDLPHLGPDHQKTFSCRVIVGEKSFKEGSGATKVVAKKNAALHALEGLFNMPVQLGK